MAHCVAVIRQALYDAQHSLDQQRAADEQNAEKGKGGSQQCGSLCMEALAGVFEGRVPVIAEAKEAQEIRVWGRRRLHVLERLIPIAKKFTVYLLGNGMPSFYVADLGPMSFTLGLSGWTANDWSRYLMENPPAC